MTEYTLKKTHKLLEKLSEYVINEIPKRNETATKSEVEKLAEYVMNEVPNKEELEIYLAEVRLEIEKRIQKVKDKIDQKADKKDIQVILNGMDAMAKNLDNMNIEQKAFISGLMRIEKRVESLEKKIS